MRDRHWVGRGGGRGGYGGGGSDGQGQPGVISVGSGGSKWARLMKMSVLVEWYVSGSWNSCGLFLGLWTPIKPGSPTTLCSRTFTSVRPSPRRPSVRAGRGFSGHGASEDPLHQVSPSQRPSTLDLSSLRGSYVEPKWTVSAKKASAGPRERKRTPRNHN